MNQTEAAAALAETKPTAFICETQGKLGCPSVSVLFDTLDDAQRFHHAIVTLFNTSK